MRKVFFVIFFLFLSIFPTIAQDYILQYEHLTSRDGLVNNFVNCVMQEKEGFVWIGTQDGLCRFDGHGFVNYKTDNERQIYLNSVNITCLAQKNDSIIWVGTAAGLHKLNIFRRKASAAIDFKEQTVQDIFIDHNQTTWVIIDKQKIYTQVKNSTVWIDFTAKYKELQYKNWTKTTEKQINGESKLIFLEEKIIGALKISSLYSFDKNKQKWQQHYYQSYQNIDFIDNSVSRKPKLVVSEVKQNAIDTLKIYQNDDFFDIQSLNITNKQNKNVIKNLSAQKHGDYLYVPQYRSLLIIDAKTYQTIGEVNLAELLSVDNAYVKDFFIDKTENIWIATFGEGIFIFPIYGLQKVRAYTVHPNNPQKGLSNSSVRAIYQDPTNQNMWVGTYASSSQIDVFLGDSVKKDFPIQSQAYIIKEDKKDSSTLWVATYNGLLRVDKENISIKNRFLEKERIRAFAQVDDSTLIFANEDSLYLFDSWKDKILFRTDFERNTVLYQTKDQTIWLGTATNGVYRLEIENNIVRKVQNYNPHTDEKITTCYVKTIYEDSKGNLWLGTTRGFYLLDRKTQTFTHSYTEKEGLGNNTVYSILEDENYHFWISTNKGISDFDVENQTFENFTEQDGLQDNEFNTKSFFKKPDGELFFGGIRGLNAFYPKNMKRNKFIPSLALTSFKKFGRDVELSVPIEQLSSLSLSQDDAQMISFEVVALNFYQNNRCEYAYKIEELNKDWIYVGANNEILLTNLAAGEYTLRITASNNHGVWNEVGIPIALKVVPPLWMRLWFQILVVFCILVVGFMLFRFRIYRLQQRQLYLEEQIRERTKELAESNQAKDKLFALIAHDLKSPITAFQGITEQIKFFLRKNKPERLLQMSQSIDQSVQSLNELLTNLLNWSLTQTKQISVNKQDISLFNSVEEAIKTHQIKAIMENIELQNQVSKGIMVCVDKDAFQTILRNLVGNAIKFTPQGGKITISSEVKGKKILLFVADTGVGISEEMQQKLFELNVGNTTRGLRGEKGTGLGLVLSYQFAKLNNINIKVESQPQKGTTFILSIPKK